MKRYVIKETVMDGECKGKTRLLNRWSHALFKEDDTYQTPDTAQQLADLYNKQSESEHAAHSFIPLRHYEVVEINY